jgi:hypothetical protein
MGPCLEDRRVVVYSDNTVTVSALNRGTSSSPYIMACLRGLFWLSFHFNFYLVSRHIPGYRNTWADYFSRLHEPGALGSLDRMFGRHVDVSRELPGHMSPSSFNVMCSQASRTLGDFLHSLDLAVRQIRGQTFAKNTRKTYLTQ